MSPSIRRAQLDQLRHSEKPKNWSEEVGGTSTLVAGGDGGEVVVQAPSLQTLLISNPPDGDGGEVVVQAPSHI